MNPDRKTPPKVSLSKAQLGDEVGAELFALCQAITSDGKLTMNEVVELSAWLGRNRTSTIPGVAFLSETLDRILADKRITREDADELLEAVEKVLPPDARKVAKAARKAVEAKRKEAAKRKKMLELERESARERLREPEDDFDFLVAGVQFEGRQKIIKRDVKVGDSVRLVPDPDNPRDEFAVAVKLKGGSHIGYVPRKDSEDVAAALEDHALYTAKVKKLFEGRIGVIPIVDLRLYRADQLESIRDLDPQPCKVSKGNPRERPWWRFW